MAQTQSLKGWQLLNQPLDDTPLARLQAFLDEALTEKRALRILDAGCGSASHFRFPGKQIHVTGIDISQKQLERHRNLDARIRADVQTYAYEPASYDVIICWWVLEHLEKPELALRGFARALAEGGLIVLAAPNVLSVKGLLTKYMPFPVHVWVYRHLHGRKTSGEDDTGPFRAYLRWSTRPSAIRRVAEQDRLRVAYLATSDVLDSHWYFRTGRFGRAARRGYMLLKAVARVATFGLLGESEFFMVLQKRS